MVKNFAIFTFLRYIIDMQELLKRRVVRQFVKFGIVGTSGVVIDWSAFYIFNHYLGVFYLTSKVLSFSLAVINSYIWNRRWTFRSENPRKAKEFTKFILAASVGLGLNTLIFYISVQKFHLSYFPSLLIATAIVTFWNFTINKLWVFKKPVVVE
jgi:putative flippase GtrA